MVLPIDQQAPTLAFLSRPETYGAAGPVERMDAHISHLFLVGERTYKLKRAVQYPYLDFSTPALRRRSCLAELVVNRRTAPDLYLGVAPVLRGADGGLLFGAMGEADDLAEAGAVDWLVVMRRFDQEDLFDAMARRGAVDEAMMVRLADVIAAFHQDARPMADFGGGDGLGWVIAENAEQMGRAVPSLFDAPTVDQLKASSLACLETLAPLLDERRQGGWVRHCHGDLHLGNVCLWRGQPTPFDAIEFSDRIANIDVLYDVAFLLMDLQHRDLRGLANVALNRYLSRTGDYGALRALPLFLSCRAGVRAQVSASRTAAGDGDRDGAEEEARRYLALAGDFLVPAEARLVAVGGCREPGNPCSPRASRPPLVPLRAPWCCAAMSSARFCSASNR